MEKNIKITEQDLLLIYSFAKQNCIDLRIDSTLLNDSHKLQSYAWCQAVTTWLISKNIVDFKIEVENGIKNK